MMGNRFVSIGPSGDCLGPWKFITWNVGGENCKETELTNKIQEKNRHTGFRVTMNERANERTSNEFCENCALFHRRNKYSVRWMISDKKSNWAAWPNMNLNSDW